MSDAIKVVINDNRSAVLQIRLDYLLDAMNESDIAELSDHIACRDEVIRQVSNQIIDGCTTMGSWGSKSIREGDGPTALDAAIRIVAESAGDIAEGEIRRLSSALKRREEEVMKKIEEVMDLRAEVMDLKDANRLQAELLPGYYNQKEKDNG